MKIRPDRLLAAERAARTTAAATIGFYIGWFWLNDADFALFAAIATTSLTRLSGYRGTRAQRVRALIWTVLAAIVIVSVGTAVSGESMPATIAAAGLTLVVVVGVTLVGVGGGYLTVSGVTLVLLWLIAAFVPSSLDDLPSRVGGLLVSGVLTLIATELVFPERSAQTDHTKVAAALHSLARLTESVAKPESYSPAEHRSRREAAHSTVLAVQPYLELSVQRPIAPTAIERAYIFMLSGLARLWETLQLRQHLQHTWLRQETSSPEVVRDAEVELYRTAQETLAASARLEVGDGSGPDIAAMSNAALQHRSVLTGFLESTSLQRQPVSPSIESGGTNMNASPPQLLAKTQLFFVDREFAWLVTATGVQSLVAVGARNAQDVAQFAPGALGELAQLDEGRMPSWRRRVRNNLSLRSVLMRDALRLAIALAIARFVAGALDLPHGFWVASGIVLVVRSSVVETGATAAKAILGTALGFLAAATFLVAFRPDRAALAIVFPIVVFLAQFIPKIAFTAGQACYTLYIVVLFTLVTPTGWHLALLRLEDILLGALIGAAAALTVWPRGATGQLSSALADLVEAGGAYVHAVAHALLHRNGPVDRDSDVLRMRQRCLTSLILARDVFAEHLQERSSRGLPTATWTRLFNSAYRLWHGGELVATHLPGGVDESLCSQLVAALDDGFEQLRQDYRAAAQLLRAPPRAHAGDQNAAVNSMSEKFAGPLEPGAHACARAMLRAPGTTAARQALRLLEVRAWLLALADDLAELQRTLTTVDRTARSARSRAGEAVSGRAASPSPP